MDRLARITAQIQDLTRERTQLAVEAQQSRDAYPPQKLRMEELLEDFYALQAELHRITASLRAQNLPC